MPTTDSFNDAFTDAPFDSAATAFIASRLRGERPILWVQDRMSSRECGQVYEIGLRRSFGLRAPLLRVNVSNPREVLWAMEEGAGCAALSAVVGEVHGDPKVLDFTATKRLALRAERSGVMVWLLRGAASRSLSAARQRWCAASRPSQLNLLDPQAPGAPSYHLDMFRARGRAPQQWGASYDRAAHSLDLVPAIRDGALAPDRGADPQATRSGSTARAVG